MAEAKRSRGRPKKEGGYHSLNIRVSNKLHDALKERQGQFLDEPPLSVVIRQLLEEGLRGHKREEGTA